MSNAPLRIASPEDCRARLDGELTKLAKKLAAY